MPKINLFAGRDLNQYKCYAPLRMKKSYAAVRIRILVARSANTSSQIAVNQMQRFVAGEGGVIVMKTEAGN